MLAACLLLETPANLGVPGGSSGTLTLQIAIDGFGDSDVQSASANVGLGGGSNIAMGPDAEPFSLVRIDNAQWFFADTDLQYGFFCGALGCLDVTVQLRNIRANLLNPTLGGLDGGGRPTSMPIGCWKRTTCSPARSLNQPVPSPPQPRRVCRHL